MQMFPQNMRPSPLPPPPRAARLRRRDKGTGAAFAVPALCGGWKGDVYLYISGFSMVSTFKNWLVPREAFSASPATQAT